MIEKIKTYGIFILTAIIGVLSALFLRQSKKTEQAKSELESALADNKIQGVDHDREIAKVHADELVDSYSELKSKYDAASHGAGGDTDLR